MAKNTSARSPVSAVPRQSRPGASALLGTVFLIATAVMAQGPEPELTHALTPITPPVPAPAFELEDMDGETHTLADYRGKVVLVNFWATWCPPCRRELPSMEAVHQALDDEGFAVLAVNQWESPDLVFAFLGQLETFPTFPILFDPTSTVAEAFEVRGLPTSYILDREGRIVYRAVGGREFDHPEIVSKIRELME